MAAEENAVDREVIGNYVDTAVKQMESLIAELDERLESLHADREKIATAERECQMQIDDCALQRAQLESAVDAAKGRKMTAVTMPGVGGAAGITATVAGGGGGSGARGRMP
jgi:uncharacterized protein YacL (UPF0231 family)